MGLRLAWDPQRGGVVDRGMGVSEPAEQSQFACLKEVRNDRYF